MSTRVRTCRAFLPVCLLAVASSGVAREDASVDLAEARTRRTEHWAAPRRIAASPTPTISVVANFLPADSAPEGDVPSEIAWLADGSAVVVANRDTDTVTFLDANTRVVTHTVQVADYPVQLAATPDGRYVLVACPLAHVVSVIDVATRALVGNVAVSGQQPYAIRVSPDSQAAVVGLVNDAVNSAFSVIDLNTLTESAVIPTTSQGVVGFWFSPESGTSGALFSRFALSPDGRTIVLPDTANARVMVYDRLGALPPWTIATAANPSGVDVSNDGLVAVVSHDFGTRTVTEIDLPARAVTGSFVGAIDYSDRLVRITPDKAFAIVAALNNVVFVDLSSGAVAANIATGTPGDLELTFDGQYLFVPNFNARVIHVPTRTLVQTIPFAASAEAAVSPTQRRAAALNNRFREDVHFYDVNGAGGSFLGFSSSGAPPEGDGTRSIAVSPDGRTAIAGNVTSRNVTVYDLVAGSARAWIDTGDRPLGVAITPDGTTAVVCNGDSDTVSIVDLATDARVANLSVVQRPAAVAVSPDSQWAYVLTVAGTDRVHFLRLQGATSFVQSSLVAGQTGSANGYAYTGISGMAVSPDGSVLAVCVSFDDQLLLVDTATRTVLTRVNLDPSPTNVFPYAVAFAPDGARAYVANSFGDSLSVVTIAGAGSSLFSTIGGIDFPSTVDVDPSGANVYVADAAGAAGSGVRVISVASGNVVRFVPLPNRATRDAHISPLDGVLHLATGTATGGDLVRVTAAGGASALVDVVPLSASPAEMGFSESLRTAVVAQPIPDGVDVRRYDLAETYCLGGVNSLGLRAEIGYSGATSISIGDFTLRASNLRPNGSGLFFYGTTTSPQIPFGDGFRCVGGSTFRLGPATPADANGENARFVDFTVPPASTGPGQLGAGVTRHFQYWYRNLGGPLGSGFNLSNGLRVTFSP